MTLLIDGHSFHYEMENLCRIFFPYERIEVTTEPREDAFLVRTGLRREGEEIRLSVQVRMNGREKKAEDRILKNEAQSEAEQERRMAVLLFGLLVEYSGFTPKWGILTGVRPVKLMRLMTAEIGLEKTLEHFQKMFLVSPEKTQLCRVTMENEEKLLKLSRPESFSLYISIPFCPTRCAYCSFVSSSVEKTMKMIPEYLSLLCRELEHTAQIAEELHLRLESVYVGGGTPTTLSAEQLKTLLAAVSRSFDLTFCREFTVEAGRPDTITPEKLLTLKDGGVTRISINPQTLNDEVLKRIGRRHTTEQTLSAFSLARSLGFGNINMDLIVGLPGDHLQSFYSTMDGVLRLAPESITVHTLALKRSSRIFQEESRPVEDGAQLPAQMLDYADRQLAAHGYAPYYLYRQSRMVGNLENTGWAKPGFESPYNVYIMDETHTILACGAGASTKLRDPHSDRIERIFNFKYPYEYISRFEEMMIRKDRVRAVYDEFCKV